LEVGFPAVSPDVIMLPIPDSANNSAAFDMTGATTTMYIIKKRAKKRHR
jgi:hypothetical protein